MSFQTRANRSEQGFTLVELLIVVIILGILAAVVIPQFNSAASESKESALMSNLATVRQAIEMFKVQHDDAFPSAAIVNEMITATDKDGTINAATGAYGPYLRNGFPKNPVSTATDPADVLVVATALSGVSGAAEGWIYSSLTGEFKANQAGAGPSTVNYYDL